MTSIANVILEADRAQSENDGHHAYDLTVQIEGGHAFRGHVTLDTMTETVTLWQRLSSAHGRLPAKVGCPISNTSDAGTAGVPVHFPLSRIIFVHYSERF